MIWAIIAVGFVIPIAVGVPTRMQPLLVGMAWPAIVAIGAAIYVHAIADAPTTTIVIPFLALPSLAGSVPGGVLGWMLKLRLARPDRA